MSTDTVIVEVDAADGEFECAFVATDVLLRDAANETNLPHDSRWHYVTREQWNRAYPGLAFSGTRRYVTRGDAVRSGFLPIVAQR